MSTIAVIGDTSSAEGQAALLLKKILERNSGTKQVLHRAAIVVEHTLNRGQYRELDLILIYEYRSENQPFVTRVAVVEVKEHGPSGIQVTGGTTLKVRYGDKWKPAAAQAAGGASALSMALRDILKLRSVFVESALLFPNAIRANIALKPPHSVLFADSDYADAMARLTASHRSTDPDLTRECYSRLVEYFRQIVNASPIDRQRLERITKQLLSEQKYEERLGEQLLMFRGRGGTGKTVTLLRLGYELRVRGNRVGVVTYNKTLVADIRRQLHLLGLDRDESEGALQAVTANSLIGAIGRHFGLHLDNDVPYRDAYRVLKQHIMEYLEVATDSDLEELRRSSPDVAYDFLLIDECQDWPDDERDIALKVYGPNRLVLADGRDQFVRKLKPTGWRDKLGKSPSQVVTLRKSLRLKVGLCRFSHAMAEQVGIPDWDLEEQPDIGIGEVHVVVAPELTPRLIEVLGERLKATKNEWVDVLCCVPPQQTVKLADGAHSTVAPLFEKCGVSVWDAVNERARAHPVTSPRHVRIVQYESCRGLEGWIVLAVAFDQFYDHKSDMLRSEADSQQALARWLMMPLTRAIDTLVIHIANPRHALVEQLREASKACGGAVFWHTSPSGIPASPVAPAIHGTQDHANIAVRGDAVRKVAEEVRRPMGNDLSNQRRNSQAPPTRVGSLVRLSNGSLAKVRAIGPTRVGYGIDWIVTAEVLEGREKGRVHRTYWKLGKLQPGSADDARNPTAKVSSKEQSKGPPPPVKVGDCARMANGSLTKVLEVEVARGLGGADWVVTVDVLEGPLKGRTVRMHWKVAGLKAEPSTGKS